MVLTCCIFDATILGRIIQEAVFFSTYDFSRNTPIYNFAFRMTLPSLFTSALPVLCICVLHYRNFNVSVESGSLGSSQIKSNAYSMLASEPLVETLYNS